MKVEQDPILSPGASGATTNPGRAAQAAASYQQRHERGRAARRAVSRGSHAEWAPAPDRPDPVDLLEVQAKGRLPDLVPTRYARMMASPFVFIRGSAIVMAHDLASTPKSGIQSQLCGDAHLLNFGMYASPERTLLFDLNDFDETLPGPWEWDVKCLAASFVVAGRVLGDGRARGVVLARRRARSLRSGLRRGDQEKDREKNEQGRAESARPRQPAGPLQAGFDAGDRRCDQEADQRRPLRGMSTPPR